MDADAIAATTELVKACSEFVSTIGSGKFALVTVFVLTVFFGVPAWREHKRNKRADMVVEHKEKEVERLAEDNRRYREIYLAKLGVPKDVLDLDRADSRSAQEERDNSR